MDYRTAIDWDFAARTGRTLVHPGPDLGRSEIAAVVAELRDAAIRAEGPVAEVTRLHGPAESSVLVVDRSSWVDSVCESARSMLGALDSSQHPSLTGSISAKALGAQAGAAFAVFASRILGQFDPFVASPRLLLVAPNVVAVERELGVIPSDFRIWVCLHEQTHRFQFGHAPWLRDHLLGLFSELLSDEDLRFGWPASGAPSGVSDLIADPAQRDVFDQVMAVMSLMEGHADVMMDRVGTKVVPTYSRIRRLFEDRRDSRGRGDWMRRLIGLDLKREQYRAGAEFCTQVIAAAGVETLNAAFSAAEFLPAQAEVRDPQLWLRRV